MSETTGLRSEHIAHLTNEGFTPAQIARLEAMGVRSLTEAQSERMGLKVWSGDRWISSSGIFFPFTASFGQLRCDTPLVRPSGVAAKYLTPVNAKSAAWLPEGCSIITEGFKDAAAGTLHGGIATGALAGVSHYRKALKPESGYTILFDADGWRNPQVFSNLVHAGKYLKGKIQLIPEIEGEPKAGLCEYFKAGHTHEDYQRLINSAFKPEDFLLELPKHWQGLMAFKLARCVRSLLRLAALYLRQIEQEVLLTLLVEHTTLGIKALRSELAAQRQIVERKRKETEEDAEPDNEIAIQFKRLKKVLGDRLRLNALTNQIELDGKSLAIGRLRLKLAIDHNLAIRSREDAEDFVRELAERNTYSPVVEYLESVYQKYGDDTSILDGFAQRYFGQPTPIYNTFIRRTLIAAVARAMQPGCQQDTALILQGKQGYHKSSFFRTLAGNEWFDDSMGGAISDKDEKMKLHRAWLVEWGELETIFKRKDISQTKGFLSIRFDSLRPPYGREVEHMARHAIIVGTTNQDEFLSDPTGDRRFWVVPVLKNIPVDLLEAERDRIWAAAVALYKAGEQWHLTREEDLIAAAIAQEFHVTDPWLDLISEFVNDKTVVSTREILASLLQIEPGRQEKTQLMRVANILRQSGWKKAIGWYQGKRQRVWTAPSDPPDPPDPPRSTSDSQVDHGLELVAVAASGNSDPPDPPPLPFSPALQYSPPAPVVENFLPNPLQIGGSGGSEADKSRVSNRSTSDPPQTIQQKVDQVDRGSTSPCQGSQAQYIGNRYEELRQELLTIADIRDGYASCRRPDGRYTTWILLSELRRVVS